MLAIRKKALFSYLNTVNREGKYLGGSLTVFYSQTSLCLSDQWPTKILQGKTVKRI